MNSRIKRICAAIAACAMLAGSAFALTPTPIPSPTATPKPKLQIDPNAGARVTPTPEPTPTPKPIRNIVIPGWTDLSFDSNATELWFDLYNPEDNAPTEDADGFYLTFTFSIAHETVNEETGETETTYEEIFSTGLIPPGQAVNSVTLEQPMEKGEYDAIIFVQPYYMETLEECNSVKFPIHLTVY